MSSTIVPIILVHGGAGDIPESRVNAKLNGVRAAAKIGHQVYLDKGCILEATQKAVEYMENEEAFNAGYGSVLTLKGEIEMEALIVEGKDLKSGAVTGVRNIAHPIALARLVMEKTPHVLLSPPGVSEFITEMGIPTVPEESLITEAARDALTKYKLRQQAPTDMEIGSTVGAIGIDSGGHMVSCTSTGGITGKMRGRVGDTPIPGAGGYADDAVGCISTTGYGDCILRYCLASRILAQIANGDDVQKACENGCKGLSERVGKSAGAIALDKKGQVGVAFSSKRMAWAYVKNGKMHYGINQGQHLEEDLV